MKWSMFMTEARVRTIVRDELEREAERSRALFSVRMAGTVHELSAGRINKPDPPEEPASAPRRG